LSFVILCRLLVTRYDAAPMLLGFAASVWWFSGRAAPGGLAAALGALVKLYPAVVPLLAAIRDRTRPGAARGKGAAVFFLTSLLGAATWLSLGGVRGVSATLRYHLERGFEYGSVYSGAQMLVAKLVGTPFLIARDHASFSSITPWSAPLRDWVLPIQVACLLVVCGVFARRGMREGVRYSGAAVLAFIVTGKVFSPQYLIWLLPFIAVLEGPIARPGFWFFAAGCAATLIAPALTGSFARTDIAVILAYNIKNALFLALLAILTFGPRSGAVGIDIPPATGIERA
jgi:hypothetical protein